MSSKAEFEYDVFLSHSVKDKKVVRDVANRLKAHGVRVWIDEWEIKPGPRIGYLPGWLATILGGARR